MPAVSLERLAWVALRLLAVGLLYWLVASAVLDAQVTQQRLGDAWQESRLSRTLAYTTPRPYVYRVLTPWLINTVARLLPSSATPALAAVGTELRQRYRLKRGHDVEYAVAYYLLFTCLLGTMLVWRHTLAQTLRASPLFYDFAPPVAMLFLPMTFMWGSFLYDLTELLLVSIAFDAFLRRAWLVYYPTFLVAVVNKESAILLAVWFFAAFGVRRDFRRLLGHLGLSLAVALPPWLAIRHVFRDHPGQAVEQHLHENLRYLLDPSSYFRGWDAYAPALPAPQGVHVVNLALLALLVWCGRQAAPRLVWRSFLYTAAAILPLFLAFGFRDELRVFGPAFPALFVIAACCLARAGETPAAAAAG